jgi:hypothetical protein
LNLERKEKIRLREDCSGRKAAAEMTEEQIRINYHTRCDVEENCRERRSATNKTLARKARLK